MNKIKKICEALSPYIEDEKTEKCPDAEFLSAYIDGQLSLEDTNVLKEHIQGCSACSFLILSIEKKGVKIEPLPGARKRWQLFPGKQRLVPVFSFLLLLFAFSAFIFFYLPQIKERGLNSRSGQGDQIQLIHPTNPVKKQNLYFKWEQHPKAVNYRLELLDEELNLIWRSPHLSQIETSLPPQVLESLKIHTLYFWKVSALSDDNQKRESRTQDFMLE